MRLQYNPVSTVSFLSACSTAVFFVLELKRFPITRRMLVFKLIQLIFRFTYELASFTVLYPSGRTLWARCTFMDSELLDSDSLYADVVLVSPKALAPPPRHQHLQGFY